MTDLDLGALPRLPRCGAEPVFREPWEAHAFGMAVALHERGVFAWTEFAARLAEQLAAARARGEADDGSRYYHHWLAALEGLVTDKRLVEAAQLAARKQAWDRAARATPHGQPILLGASATGPDAGASAAGQDAGASAAGRDAGS